VYKTSKFVKKGADVMDGKSFLMGMVLIFVISLFVLSGCASLYKKPGLQWGPGDRWGPEGDADGDGIKNDEDDDIDGDSVKNDEDDDIDGDGVKNDNDKDDDGDLIEDKDDESPKGPEGEPSTTPILIV